MAEAKTDKKTESINALRNANKHLADVFTDLDKKDRIMKVTVDDLQRVATQCGELQVKVWVGQTQSNVHLKAYLTQIASTLNEAR